MKFSSLIITFSFIILLTSCTQTSTTKITNKNDYEQYLSVSENLKLKNEKMNLFFWENKLEKQQSQYPYLRKIAAVNSALFSTTGDIDYLIEAEQKLQEVNRKRETSGGLRALARNYISQHRFQESLELLKKAEINGEKLRLTQGMLFDVHLELGNYKEAEEYLTEIKQINDFGYLIRASKWNDVQGNLDTAISFLERALEIVKSGKDKDLLDWSYSNLADYYGHNNEIQKSYNYYLKSLEINPANAYSKKGIAWIVYSYEKNPEEAFRIIEAIQKNHQSPDYYLLKSEMAEYMNDTENKNKNIQLYLSSVQNPKYGDMYNHYNAKLYLEELEKKEEALAIIQKEIKNRPTPESYDLLAWVSYQKGEVEDALIIVEKYVKGKTYEPEAMYHLAEIYKANGYITKAKKLKEELMESSYELGPVMASKIENI
jgi:hypothetical protein